MHDLNHLAVETILQIKHGFYGLIAAGWEIDDTTGKGAKGALPDEALTVEHLVGMLDAERNSGVASSAEELNQHAAMFAAKNGLKATFHLSDENLRNIRSLAADFQGQWMTLPLGHKLELNFSTDSGRAEGRA